jgi:hypothetical protein
MELKEGQNGKPNIELNNTGRSGEGCREPVVNKRCLMTQVAATCGQLSQV